MPEGKPSKAADLPTEELWEEFKQSGDPALKRILVERHQQLVRYVAERICSTLPRSIDVDDLIQDGTFGLMDAIEKFDHRRGIKFKTYCGSRVRGAILDALRSQDWVPRLVRQRAARLEVIRRQWLSGHGREPTQSELARQLKVKQGDLDREVKKALPRTIMNVSDRRTTGDQDMDGQLDTLAESKEDDPVEVASNRDLMDELTRSLTPKEKGILHMYYLDGLTLREIGHRMQLTESRVCQIHSNVIKRLRERLKHQREQYMSAPHPLRPEVLQRRLPARRRLGRSIEVLESCPSTSDVLRQRAEDAAARGPAELAALDGALVAAEQQLAGRGRRSRDWWSGPPRANLAWSLLLTPPLDPPEALGVLAACALAAAARPWTAGSVALKWPNDLMIGGAKTAGLLIDVPAAAPCAILGVGMNVLAAPPPGVGGYPTTALACHAERPPDRTALLALWLAELEIRLAAYARAGPARAEAEFLALLRRWAPHGVRLAGADPCAEEAAPRGPLIEFSVSRGLTWGTEGATATRPPGWIPGLEPLLRDS